MENLPEYIEGIPTNKKASKERKKVRRRAYLRQTQRKHPESQRLQEHSDSSL